MPEPSDIVERRRRYIQRQIELNRGDVNVKFRGQLPQGTGATNRHGMPRLPIGQHEVRNWPVLDLGDLPEIDTSAWRLDIGGQVENPVRLDWAQFMALPQVDDVSDFHCVTTWSRYENRWRGVRFSALAEMAVPTDDAKFVLCTGYDRMPGSDIPYTTNLPLDRAVEDDVLLVHTWEGQPLPREHGGAGAHDHPEAVRVEGDEVDQEDRVPATQPTRILGTSRLLEFRRTLVQRPLLDA
jgi:DMSO/TMAO reductase YedYZ molybdopterin-dependent catalytic subunit